MTEQIGDNARIQQDTYAGSDMSSTTDENARSAPALGAADVLELTNPEDIAHLSDLRKLYFVDRATKQPYLDASVIDVPLRMATFAHALEEFGGMRVAAYVELRNRQQPPRLEEGMFTSDRKSRVLFDIYDRRDDAQTYRFWLDTLCMGPAQLDASFEIAHPSSISGILTEMVIHAAEHEMQADLEGQSPLFYEGREQSLEHLFEQGNKLILKGLSKELHHAVVNLSFHDALLLSVAYPHVPVQKGAEREILHQSGSLTIARQGNVLEYHNAGKTFGTMQERMRAFGMTDEPTLEETAAAPDITLNADGQRVFLL